MRREIQESKMKNKETGENREWQEGKDIEEDDGRREKEI